MSSCPDDEAVARLLEGSLSSGARAAIEAHAGECRQCCRLLAELGRSIHQVDGERLELGRYQILRQLDHGAMGVVYEAWDPVLERRLAIKCVRPDRTDPDEKKRLLAEARALAAVAHPNVVAVHDVGVAGNAVFIATELVDGDTAGRWRERAQPSWRAIVDIYQQIALGLDAAHRRGLLHRDVKPSNVLVAIDGRARLADFGLATAGDARTAGTPAYMAPEQLRGEAIDARADQYALALCVIEALTGERLRPETDPAAICRAWDPVWRADPPPRALADVLARATAPEAADRFESVGALSGAMEAALAAAPARSPRRGQWAVAALLALGLAGGAAALWWPATASREPAPAAPPPIAATPPAADTAIATTQPAADTAIAAPQPAADPAIAAMHGTPDAASTTSDRSAPRVAPAERTREAPPAAAPGPPAGPVTGSAAGDGDATQLLTRAAEALIRYDGKQCLADLDRAAALDPSTVDASERSRALCEMIAGRCEQGSARLRRFTHHAQPELDADAMVSAAQQGYCSPGSGDTKDRLSRLLAQATIHARAGRCRQLAVWTQDVEASATSRQGAVLWSAVALCWDGKRDCDAVDRALDRVRALTEAAGAAFDRAAHARAWGQRCPVQSS